MTDSNPFIDLNQLKTTLLSKSAAEKPLQFSVDYDKEFDALYITFIAPDPTITTLVHYIDDYVAFVYQADDMEIVGLQLEDFEFSFLPNHDTVMRIWKADESVFPFDNLGDMMREVDKRRPKIAREIVKATEDVLGKPGLELVALLA